MTVTQEDANIYSVWHPKRAIKPAFLYRETSSLFWHWAVLDRFRMVIQGSFTMLRWCPAASNPSFHSLYNRIFSSLYHDGHFHCHTNRIMEMLVRMDF